MVTVEDVRRVARTLPRTTEHLIRDQVKFRVKQLVYVAFSQDETLMGFARCPEVPTDLPEQRPGGSTQLQPFREPLAQQFQYSGGRVSDG